MSLQVKSRPKCKDNTKKGFIKKRKKHLGKQYTKNTRTQQPQAQENRYIVYRSKIIETPGSGVQRWKRIKEGANIRDTLVFRQGIVQAVHDSLHTHQYFKPLLEDSMVLHFHSPLTFALLSM